MPGAGLAGATIGWCFTGSKHTEVPRPDVAALNGFAVEAKFARFESTGASALHTSLPCGFNSGDATGTQGIGVCSSEVCRLHQFVGQKVANLQHQ